MSIKYGLEYIGYIDQWTDEERLSDEEIVRCMDCRWCMAYSKAAYCDRFAHALPTPVELLDGFCAWGERKAEA